MVDRRKFVVSMVAIWVAALGLGRSRWEGGGRIAESAMWNAALTDEEVLQLSVGVSPLLVRPEALVYYVPNSVVQL